MVSIWWKWQPFNSIIRLTHWKRPSSSSSQLLSPWPGRNQTPYISTDICFFASPFFLEGKKNVTALLTHHSSLLNIYFLSKAWTTGLMIKGRSKATLPILQLSTPPSNRRGPFTHRRYRVKDRKQRQWKILQIPQIPQAPGKPANKPMHLAQAHRQTPCFAQRL